ncbi:MAG: hypothetical protein PVJ02_18600 [Gemmatimonadota bacterium]|jgi:hypothetical protein
MAANPKHAGAQYPDAKEYTHVPHEPKPSRTVRIQSRLDLPEPVQDPGELLFVR